MVIYGFESFSSTEKNKLQLWLNQSFQATNAVLGPYPFTAELYLTKRQNADEPVPWAYTQRMQQQQVYFEVDTRYSLDEFQQDWTAAHEFSHLALPLLDREDKWFAEGFASFMQYQVLQQQQQLKGTPDYWYQQKLQPLAAMLEHTELDLVQQSKNWLQQRRYKQAYWASCLFFIEADHLLRQQKSSLAAVIRHYQQQNRLKDQELQQLIRSLDRLLPKPLFAPLLKKYQQQSAKLTWRQHPAYIEPPHKKLHSSA